MVVLEAEGGIVILHHADVVSELLRHLVEGAVDVRVVHRQHPDAQQPGQSPGELVAVDGAVLGDTQGQVTVGTLLVAVHEVVHRAVHRLQVVGSVIHLHRRVHRVCVVRQVPAGLEQLLLAQHRRGDSHVAVGLLGLDRVALYLRLESLTVRQPDRESLTNQLVNHVELHLLSDLLVVTLGGLLELADPVLQCLLAGVAHAVYPDQRLALAVRPPVGLAGAGQPEPAQVGGAGHVRAAAQVDEVTLPIR